MKDVILSSISQQPLASLEKNLPHTLILSGEEGVGLGTIAQAHAGKYDKNALLITPDEKGSIKIDTVRHLYRHTGTKSISHQFVVIDDADSLAAPAQNALLKLLEEPPPNTFFVLTTHHPQLLLPTIRSRAQEIEVLPLSLAQTNQLLDDQGIKDSTTRSQLLFIAKGLPAELLRLITDEAHFKTRSAAIRQARQFMSASLYEKLVSVYLLGNNRSEALELLRSCLLIVENTLKQKASREAATLLSELLRARDKLLNDGNVRTQLLALSVSLTRPSSP